MKLCVMYYLRQIQAMSESSEAQLEEANKSHDTTHNISTHKTSKYCTLPGPNDYPSSSLVYLQNRHSGLMAKFYSEGTETLSTYQY